MFRVNEETFRTFPHSMQDDSALSRTFFERTNRLAAQMGLQVEDLPSVLGIGRRTLFECRSADSAASAKSWAKLQSAEEKINKNARVRESAKNEAYVNRIEETLQKKNLCEDEGPYSIDPRVEKAPTIESLTRRVESLESVLDAAMAAWYEFRSEIKNQKEE